MNVIILGVGEVGLHLGATLSEKQHNVTVIDKDRESLIRLEEHCDLRSIEGDAANLAILEQANIRECDLLLAVTSNDEVNMLTCLLAKNLAPKVTTVCRLLKDFYFQGTKTFYRNKFGIDLIVCPEILAALEIVHHISVSGTTAVDTLADGHIEVTRIEVDDKFKYKNYEINSLPLPSNILISTIIRDREVIIPGGHDKVLLGDELYVVGETSTIDNLGKILGLKKNGGWFFSDKKVAFVLGGGRIGELVAEMLQRKHISVKLIEEDFEQSQMLAEELEGVLVLREDGTDYQFLQEEGVESADYFVATCNDETNLLASLLAKDMGVKNIITVANGPGYKSVLSRLGLKNVVNPRRIAAETILDFVENQNMLIHLLTPDGRAEIIEIYTEEDFPLEGKALMDIKFPPNTLVCSVLRGEEVFIPKGGDAMKAGDIVVVFTLKENTKAIREMFLTPK